MGCSPFDYLFPGYNKQEENNQGESEQEKCKQEESNRGESKHEKSKRDESKYDENSLEENKHEEVRLRHVQERNLAKMSKLPKRAHFTMKSRWGAERRRPLPTPRLYPIFESGFSEVLA